MVIYEVYMTKIQVFYCAHIFNLIIERMREKYMYVNKSMHKRRKIRTNLTGVNTPLGIVSLLCPIKAHDFRFVFLPPTLAFVAIDNLPF